MSFKTHDYLKHFIDNVLLEHGGLPHAFLLAVHLDFLCVEQDEGVILSHFYYLSFLVRGLLIKSPKSRVGDDLGRVW